MGDYENVMAEVRAAYGRHEISDACARVIAAMYHGGQSSVGYAFVSTGAIPETADDLWHDLWPTSPVSGSDEFMMLGALGSYAINRSDRGPVEGWSRLWLSKHADYPHEFGYLYDCKACEETCYCSPESTECIACGS